MGHKLQTVLRSTLIGYGASERSGCTNPDALSYNKNLELFHCAQIWFWFGVKLLLLSYSPELFRNWINTVHPSEVISIVWVRGIFLDHLSGLRLESTTLWWFWSFLEGRQAAQQQRTTYGPQLLGLQFPSPTIIIHGHGRMDSNICPAFTLNEPFLPTCDGFF